LKILICIAEFYWQISYLDCLPFPDDGGGLVK
jgi:hypothetical protein